MHKRYTSAFHQVTNCTISHLKGMFQLLFPLHRRNRVEYPIPIHKNMPRVFVSKERSLDQVPILYRKCSATLFKAPHFIII